MGSFTLGRRYRNLLHLAISSSRRVLGGLIDNLRLSRLLLPLGRLSPLLLQPRSGIAERAAAGAIARTAQALGQVLGRDLGHELLLVAGAQDVDLLHGDGVQPSLDGAPGAAEAPGRVDQVHASEALRVVVLRHGGGLLDVGVDLRDLGNAHALQVHDCAARLKELAGFARGGGEAGVGEALVFDCQVGEHALGGGDLVHGRQVDAAHLLYVDRATIL
jgi:hypothetical protein